LKGQADAEENGGMAQRRKREQIERLLRSYRERGGVTRQAFCESHGIARSTLGYYLRRYGREAGSARLIEVKLQAGEHRSAPFALVLGNGRRIECGQAELPQLIRIAESC